MTRALIVGFGAIGRLVHKFLSENTNYEICIYTGRNAYSDNLLPKPASLMHGPLETALENFSINKKNKIKVYWCCGPDFLDEKCQLESFLNLTFDCPLRFLGRLEKICGQNYTFVHFSTIAGFEGKKVEKDLTSFRKTVSISDPYTWAKKLLDCWLESNYYSGSVVNLRLSNLLIADYQTSQRKVIVRLAKKLKSGENIEVPRNAQHDFIIGHQIKNALTIINSDKITSKSINICNGERFYLLDLLSQFQIALRKTTPKVGEIVPVGPVGQSSSYFEPIEGVGKVKLSDLQTELLKLI